MSGISPKKIAADMRADAAAHHATVTSGNAPNYLTVKPSTISYNCNISTFRFENLPRTCQQIDGNTQEFVQICPVCIPCQDVNNNY